MSNEELEVIQALRSVREQAEGLETSRADLRDRLIRDVDAAIKNFNLANGEFGNSLRDVFTTAAVLGGRFRFEP